MKRRQKTPVTTGLIVLCALVWLGVNFLPMGELTEASRAILFGAYYKILICAGEWWRLLTVGFVHSSYWHLLMNMYSLHNLGRILEIRYGVLRYLTVLFVSVIGGSLFMFVMEGNTVGVGLSGGLYGLMASLIITLVKNGSWKHPVLRAYLLQIITINLLINFAPGIAYTAHLGGFLTGALLTVILDRQESFTGVRIHGLIAGMILIGVLIWRIPQSTYIRKDERYLGTDSDILVFYRDHGLENYAMKLAKKIDSQYDTIYLEEILEDS